MCKAVTDFFSTQTPVFMYSFTFTYWASYKSQNHVLVLRIQQLIRHNCYPQVAHSSWGSQTSKLMLDLAGGRLEIYTEFQRPRGRSTHILPPRPSPLPQASHIPLPESSWEAICLLPWSYRYSKHLESSVGESPSKPDYKLPKKMSLVTWYLRITHKLTPLSRKEVGVTSQNLQVEGGGNSRQKIFSVGFQPSPVVYAPPSLPVRKFPHRSVSLGADLASYSLYEYDPQRGEPLSAAPELCYHRY